MPTLEKLIEWQKGQGISRREMADRLHVNYKALCPVLAGTKPLSPQLAARIGELMERHNGGLTVTLPDELSPLPAEWESLDYADHTLVEEMLARLLQLLICTISPARIDLHADFWNDSIITRLNFNLGTKLRGITLPQLHFATITAEKLAGKLYRAAATI